MRGKAVKQQRQDDAQKRQNARDSRTNEEQLARLNNRPGNSAKERGKLPR
jgi:hypothetical protein